MPGITQFTLEKGKHICRQLANGRCLRDIVSDSEVDCEISTAFNWVLANEDFKKEYQEAQKLQTESIRDSIVKDFNTENLGIIRTEDKIIINNNAVGLIREKINYLKVLRTMVFANKVKKLRHLKTCEEIVELIQELLSDSHISYDEAEKLCKVAELRLKAVELKQLSERVKQIEDSNK
jgi:hypothetical protein